MNWLNLILSIVLTTLNIYYMTSKISHTKFKKINSILFIMILTILYIINLLYFDGIYRILFSITIIFLSMYLFLFNRNSSKSLYYSILYILLSFFAEIIACMVLALIFGFTAKTYNNFDYSLLIFSLFSIIFIIMISKNKKLNKYLNDLENRVFKNRTNNFYILILLILLILFEVNNKIKYGSNVDYYLNIVLIIFVVITIILFFINKYQRDKAEGNYIQMLEYVSKYEKIINEQGKKNHEFNNQLMVLCGYIDNKKKLKEYLDSMIEGHKGGKNYTIEQLSYFPDGGLKGLIYHKLSRIEEYNIKPYLYIDKNVKETFENKFDVNIYTDITKLFGVFLDNAIEAAKDADKKEIEIDMKIKDNYLIVTISNTYSKDVDINKIGKKGFTTKGVGHGFGLSLVKDIAKKNSKIETVNDVDNNMFKQTILIDLK